LIPWNTCGVYIVGVLGISAFEYFPYAVFNLLMPITVIVLAYMGIGIADKDGYRMTKRAQAKKKIEMAEQNK
ncbi:MAG: Na+/H+ antiporter NhaC family protein, partial [Eubacterium sp.]